MLSLVALLAASAALVGAQTTHQIVVGGPAGLTYTPNSITAAVGDIVTFEFQTINHTVTQSAFSSPCTLLQNATTQQSGFDSGFVPVSANASAFPAWSLKITGSSPIWFYCRQTGHCVQGMVGAINAPTDGSNTFAAFQALAKSNGTSSSGTTTTGSTSTGSTNGSTSAGSTTTPSPAGRNAVTRSAVALTAVAAGVFLLA